MRESFEQRQEAATASPPLAEDGPGAGAGAGPQLCRAGSSGRGSADLGFKPGQTIKLNLASPSAHQMHIMVIIGSQCRRVWGF